MDPFLNCFEPPLPPPFSVKYFHRRPSTSSQQINLKLDPTNCSSISPRLAAAEGLSPALSATADAADEGSAAADEEEEARSALIRRVSRTRRRAASLEGRVWVVDLGLRFIGVIGIGVILGRLGGNGLW